MDIIQEDILGKKGYKDFSDPMNSEETRPLAITKMKVIKSRRSINQTKSIKKIEGEVEETQDINEIQHEFNAERERAKLKSRATSAHRVGQIRRTISACGTRKIIPSIRTTPANEYNAFKILEVNIIYNIKLI